MTAIRIALFALPLVAFGQQVSFDRDIRPIMSDTCFRCHGPDVSSRMANMRLDLREEALKPRRNGTPIVPGDTEHSEIIQRIFAKDGHIMPPPFAHKELTAKQKDTIRQWVAQGAKYETHWSYVPVKRPPVPGGATSNPIDAFIQARLTQDGLKPSPEADRRTLVRRVTLDLTGLAPTSAEAAAFVSDNSPDAYEKLVDRLLASPAYAEQQAVRWLDAVRYADTAGYHSDSPRPAWPYRDYVLRAFRDNKPFDVFTREQLAGDLMPNATVEQKVASAYNRMGRTSAEGGVQPKEYLAKYGAERVRTLSTTWLGSTMACSECHNHKFDPILTKDFYSMKAFFADVQEKGLVPDFGPDAFAPKMPVYKPGEKEKIDALNQKIQSEKNELDRKADALAAERRAWEKETLARAEAGGLAWKFPIPTAVSAKSAKLTVRDSDVDEAERHAHPNVAMTGGAGLVMVNGPNPDNETYSVTLKPGAGTWTSVGLEVDTDGALAGADISRGADRFVISEIDAVVSPNGRGAARKAPFIFAYSTVSPTAGFPAMAMLDGNPKTGFSIVGRAKPPFLILRFAQPVHTTAASTITVRVHQDSDYRQATIGRFRVALSSGAYSWDNNAKPKAEESKPEENASSISGLPRNLAKALEQPEQKRSPEQTQAIRDYFEYSSPQLFPARLALAKLETEQSFLDGAVAEVMITQSVEPRETRVLPRGNWMDDSGEVLQPAIPEFLGHLNTNGARPTRLDLANWLVSPDNPLTARVYVNRMWSQFFGTGISKTVEDLGSQGEWPTHPELLEWLAAEFMNPQYDAAGTHPWDIRHMVRLIVLSNTYRQSSLSSPELDQRDPENRLLARQSRFRVDAESVHDLMLQISGLLVNKFGGPSVNPYQPEGYLAALNFPKRGWSASRNDDLYRRGVYTFWQRTFLHPTMMNFDAPTREECTVNRINSNTPLQALDLLNDPTFVEAARVFGERILRSGGANLTSQVQWAFQQATGRQPENDEVQILTDLHAKSLAHFKSDPSGTAAYLKIGDSTVPTNIRPADLAAMTNVARVIMNLHEVITRD
ncbi:MAG TPA: PSD1 and planctomycete cytochrome C domain-containing protein [Bryobacteraceae bacterium]